MKYFSSESVANAYKGFQGSITNKSWGVLAIMHQLDSMIVPGRTYAVNCSSLSTYIEKLFCLGSKKSYMGRNGMLSSLPNGTISLTSRDKLYLIFLTSSFGLIVHLHFLMISLMINY